MGAVLSAAQLISEYGTHVGATRRCSCCDKYTLYAIRYPDTRGTVLLCARCDTDNDPNR